MVSTRELCDQCHTAIFNIHFFCDLCGLSICPNCYDLRKSNKTLRDQNSTNKDRDENGWFYCSSKQKKLHTPDNLKCIEYIPPHGKFSDNLSYRLIRRIDIYHPFVGSQAYH
jgi:hypothetical protein